MLKIGIVGNNTCIDHYWLMVQDIPNCTISASMDAHCNLADICNFKDYNAFLNEIDALLVINPNKNSHFITEKAIRNQIPCFIDSPFAPSIEDGKNLMNLVQEAKVGMQISNPIQYNEALQSVTPYINYPNFIECNRLTDVNLSDTQSSIVLSQMIYDIDIVLNIVKSGVKKISATGVIMNNTNADVVNARIEFENGCVANITSSRISMKNMRKSRFFQKDAYISVDYLDKVCEVVRMKDAPEVPGDFDMILQNAEGVKKQIYFDNPQVDANNAILDELETFADAINNNTTPIVTLEDGTEALRVAYQIIECMNARK